MSYSSVAYSLWAEPEAKHKNRADKRADIAWVESGPARDVVGAFASRAGFTHGCCLGRPSRNGSALNCLGALQQLDHCRSNDFKIDNVRVDDFWRHGFHLCHETVYLLRSISAL